MKKTLANDIVHILPASFDAINEYIASRIDDIHLQLEKTKDTHRVFELQGAVEELRRFLKLRDSAINVLKVNDHGY